MIDILDKVNQWFNQPGHELYSIFAFIAVGTALFYVIPPILNKLTAPYRSVSLSKAVVSGNLVVYSGTMSGKVTYKGRQNTRLVLTNTKIETLNAETGTVIKTRILYDDPYEILLIGNGMIWTRFRQWSHIDAVRPFQANVLDLNTLETRYDNKAVEQHFEFAAGEKLADMNLIDDDGADIAFVSNAGNTCSFASPEGKVQIPQSTSESFSDGGEWSDPLSVRSKTDSRRYAIYLGDDSIGTESFIEPVWVNGVFQNEDCTGIVLVHSQTIDPCPFVSLTHLGLDGKIRWTVTQQSMGVGVSTERDDHAKFAYCGTYEKLIVYRVEAPRGPNKLIAINKSDGAIVWTKSFSGNF